MNKDIVIKFAGGQYIKIASFFLLLPILAFIAMRLITIDISIILLKVENIGKVDD